MDSEINRYAPHLFPFFFVGMWLFVTASLGAKAGWYDLARKYPNQAERPLLTLRFLGGKMGGVSMSGILRLESCPSGLRIGILRLFGPFSRDFFVPWNEIQAEQTKWFLWDAVKLTLGEGGQSLMIQDYVADRLALSVPEMWPDKRPVIRQSVLQAALASLKIWAIGMALTGAFFSIVPYLLSGQTAPKEMFIFLAIMLGIASAIDFVRRIQR